jgi:hypothetical protein
MLGMSRLYHSCSQLPTYPPELTTEQSQWLVSDFLTTARRVDRSEAREDLWCHNTAVHVETRWCGRIHKGHFCYRPTASRDCLEMGYLTGLAQSFLPEADGAPD